MSQIACSFCGKRRADVRKLISGPNVYICDECVGLCTDIIEEETARPTRDFPRPREILQHLDEYVIGQTWAKRVLAVAVYNHYKRINYAPRKGDVELAKGNILLLGPTGSGKTLLAQSLARKLDVPFALADATTLTEAGYVGEDVESIVKSLYRAADGDVERAAEGIICIDEIDKLARKGGGPSLSRDVSGEGVQQALLKLLEGRQASITPDGSRNRPQHELIQVDTSNILFICTGSFTGIEDMIQQRVGARGMGFGANIDAKEADRNALRSQVRHEDLVKYGMIPEFVGRIPVVVGCDELDVDSLVEILWKPKNALLRQYQRLLELDGVELQITDDGMRQIAVESVRRKSGARGLRAVMEEVMIDVMYELPALDDVSGCVIDEDAVQKRSPPKLIREKKAS
ncbi:MAG: ATP-dependent Clp protease ATP-binding subunit ClpX [Deltaproteobacteria bacterium]|nr:ATP-dependent Clp protease ATP-binding subunit ClpX [Deltaproteobacteria bacterium]